eukprot:gnl/TRDRNA2_/TRDRNA2_162261_c1_seq1.p2 gnl/TRDRNA2_/TRDRNA2_162261_c1~~gnl/TRDRNA2_/TRDRNA2_162261_c1_seq1.p2  ORF type:complete len:102 (-),score=11.01 gnl/TRDRNA2_/TRDRNA2_162261_c1_seq1:139-444(-)
MAKAKQMEKREDEDGPRLQLKHAEARAGARAKAGQHSSAVDEQEHGKNPTKEQRELAPYRDDPLLNEWGTTIGDCLFRVALYRKEFHGSGGGVLLRPLFTG